jgi:prepilin-type N-terminal cleavage/methylation domain-containing protein
MKVVTNRQPGGLVRQGFTLVEIMIVVTIIGLIAMMAIPAYRRSVMNAQNGAYASDVRVASGAFEMFAIENGKYPADASRGVEPPEMAAYLTKFDFTEETPIGGLWDWDHDVFGVVGSISVAGSEIKEPQLKRLDKTIDDGFIVTGILRDNGDRILYVLEE